VVTQRIERSVIISASPAAVWESLTTPSLMKQWMAEPRMAVEVVTDWTEGGPIVIRGFHIVRFENRGTVLRFEPNAVLRYSHLSSMSRLPDKPENYSIVEFRLAPADGRTSLTVTLSGFPTEAILKHHDFYWRVTVQILKQFVEAAGQATARG